MIRRRQTFYVPGYDPRGVAPYYRLFRSELRRHAEMHGFTATTGRIEDGPPDAPWLRRWRSTCETPAGSVETIVDFCGWDDLIEEEARLGFAECVWRAAKSFWAMLIGGIFWWGPRIRRRAVLFMLYPYVVVLLYVLAMAAMIGGGAALGGLLGPIGAVAGGLAGLAGAVWFHRYTRRMDAKWYIWHLVVHWDFLRRQGRYGVPEVVGRSRAAAEKIRAAINDPDIDEVVVVGHSHGCFVALGIVGRVIEITPELGAVRPGLALLNLGTGLPSTAAFGPTPRFLSDLRALLTSRHLAWYESAGSHDVMSATCDYGELFGIDLPADVPRRPLSIALDYRQVLKPETFAALRSSFYRLHFQYLMAPETGRGYDYFDLVCSPKPLVTAEKLNRRRGKARRSIAKAPA